MLAKRVRISLLVVVVVAVSACGSSYKGLSKADLIKQSDAVCKTYAAQLNGIFTHVATNPTLAEIKRVYNDQLVPRFRKEVVALRALKPPKADRAAVSKIFDDLSTGVDELSTAVGRSKTLKELESISPPGLKSAQAGAGAYGMKVCGKS